MLEIFSTVLIGSRQKNDDRALVNNSVINDGSSVHDKLEFGVIGVFDGVGGYPNGGLAAEITAETLMKLNSKNVNEEDIKKVILQAESKIFVTQINNPSCHKMSTTAAGIYFCDNKALVFNVGDSAVYRYRKPFISLLTKEHTVAHMNRELGLSVNQRDENTLTRSIGSGYSEPDIQQINIFKDDLFIICSDGISKYISDEEFEDIIEKMVDIEKAGEKMIQRALANGSKDNLSIILGRSIQNE